jgi:hypothetical protein
MPLGHTWNDTDVTELLSFRHKSLLPELNGKHPFWNSPTGNGDVLNIVVQKNVQQSVVIVSDILDSDHLPIIFHLLDHIRTRNL